VERNRNTQKLARAVVLKICIKICIKDISAVLRARDLRFRLSFIIWAGLMLDPSLIIILKLNFRVVKNSGDKKIKISFEIFVKTLVKDAFSDVIFGTFSYENPES
jgi:hypothetical protein